MSTENNNNEYKCLMSTENNNNEYKYLMIHKIGSNPIYVYDSIERAKNAVERKLAKIYSNFKFDGWVQENSWHKLNIVLLGTMEDDEIL
tara:strand:+ start:1114 stop:1380 length:267 start_codon:yes stop_codon:yes gene_type:complete